MQRRGLPLRHVVLVMVLLLVGGCAVPRPVGPAADAAGARRLLAALAQGLQLQQLRQVALLFTPECRASCRGFVPHPVGVQGRVIRAHWTPRLDDGELLEDLARGILSYDKLGVARIEPRRWRSYEGMVLVQAELHLAGADPSGRRVEDRGLIDLALQRGPDGWRIARMQLTKVTRRVELRADEVPPVEGPAPVAAATQPATSAVDETPPVEDAAPAEPPASVAGDGLLAADLLSLTATGATGALPLRRLAGASATLMLITDGRGPGTELCRNVAKLTSGRPGCAGLHLLLGAGGRASCELSELRADARSRRALVRARSLLPLVVVVDGDGRAVRMVSGAAPGIEIEAELDRRCPREKPEER